MNNIIAIFTIFLVGLLFYFMFRSLFSELIKTATLTKKDGFFMLIATFLVFIVYIFLERLHH